MRDAEHEVRIERPGRTAPDSVTVSCKCHAWSITVHRARPDGSPDLDEAERVARSFYAAHERDVAEQRHDEAARRRAISETERLNPPPRGVHWS